MSNSSSILQLVNLTKFYHDASRELQIIENLHFNFLAGKSCAIIGRSGVGKSTLLHIMGGLDKPSSGSVHIDGVDLGLLSDAELTRFRGEKIGFIFQFHHLLPEFTALENVAMPLIIAGTKRSVALREARVLLQRVGLADRLEHVPGRLSGGEQQRVAIARSLVTKPAVVLADEPTGNLDVETAVVVRDVLLEIQSERQATLIIVTHSEDFAERMDYTVEMKSKGGLELYRCTAETSHQ
jgi:lipoprotein-releasing system ATP-binding protein